MTGKLMLIGGGLETTPSNPIIRRFYREVGGSGRNVAIITTASMKPKKSARKYAYVLGTMGVRPEIIDIRKREDANKEKVIEILENTDGIFFTGGNQLRLTSILGGSGMYEALLRRFSEGVVVAGTSAGAAALPEVMIAYGNPESALRKGGLQLAPGLGFMADVIVDTHFMERNRIGRVLQAVAENPELIGLGISEDTAVVINHRNSWEIIGDSSVMVIDGKGIKNTNIPEINEDEPIGVTGVVIHVLTHGSKYHKETGEAMLPD